MTTTQNTNKILLDKNDWKTLFPDPSSKKGKWIRNFYPLQIQIALDQPENKIISLINSLATNSKDMVKLNRAYPEHRLAPLHVAIMKGRVSIVKALLSTKLVELNTLDGHGWSPLHHAAIRSYQIFQLLIKNGADTRIRTPLGGTYEDLQRLTGVIDTIRFPSQLHWRDLNGTFKAIKPDQLVEKTNLKKYRDESLYHPGKKMQSLWANSTEQVVKTKQIHPQFNRWCQKLYDLFVQNPPQLAVGEEPTLTKMGVSDTCKALFVIKKQTPFSVLCEYTGEVKSGTKEYNSGYNIREIDALNVGNVARFSNDGFPNSILVQVAGSHGNGARHLLMNVNEISGGEQVFWNYGCAEYLLKWQTKYALLNRKSMHAFFKQKKPGEYLKEFNDKGKNIYSEKEKSDELCSKLCLEQQFIFDRLLYPLFTPAAQVDLALSKITLAADWHDVLNSSLLQNMFKLDPSAIGATIWLNKLLWHFETNLQSINSELEENIRKDILRNIGMLSGNQLCKGIERASEWIRSKQISKKPVDEALSLWQEELKNLLSDDKE